MTPFLKSRISSFFSRLVDETKCDPVSESALWTSLFLFI